MIHISPLQPADRAEWEALARGYKAFYETDLADARYEETWRALIAGDRVHGLAARIDGRMVGIAHYLFHAQTWGPDACYLQDLFTAQEARGQGVATALIDAVAARRAGARRGQILLADQGGQCARPRPLRPHRRLQGLPALRLSVVAGAGISAEQGVGMTRRICRFSAWRCWPHAMSRSATRPRAIRAHRHRAPRISSTAGPMRARPRCATIMPTSRSTIRRAGR